MSNVLELATLDVRVNHVEGVAWGPDEKVYAGGETGQVYRLDLTNGSCEEYANTGGSLLGLALDGDANLYACDMELGEVVRITPAGTLSTYSAGTQHRPMRLPNYPVFDADGNLYVSDSGEWGDRDGVIWRIRPGGETEIWDESANGFTNGMCLTADGGALFVVESSPPLVSRVEIGDDGMSGERTVIVELPRMVPDGLALDAEGNLFIAMFNPNIIYRRGTDGELAVMYDDWEQLKLIAPTNIAFGGPDLKTLLIASFCGVNLNTAPMEVAGLPVRYPKVP